ncbi:MAG: sugar phosphate isomerase/epimerase [Chitinophagaceae bacterium]|nr:sugar phosphate isomerase/epimerase [Chitinophagaceae bacterium]
MTQQHFSRRNFLRLGGFGIAAAAMPDAMAGMAFKAKPAKLSVQLYSVSEQIVKDTRSTLWKIADIGFKNVETAFWPRELSLQTAAGYLKEFGLGVSSAHVEIPMGGQKKVFLDTARAFNCQKMIWHGWPEDKRYSSLEGTKELVRIYNEAGRFAKDNGLQFGIHNHWWEYRNKPGGRYVYEILQEELDPDIFFEIDTYWVKVAGHDPATIVSKLGSRVKLMHIKDGPARWSEKLAEDNPDPMTPVGKGTQDFPKIIKAAGTNPEWLVVEMDKVDMDVFEALRQSFDYMTAKRLARP